MVDARRIFGALIFTRGEVRHMRQALDPTLVQAIYDRKAKHYDQLHGLLTLWSDQRGRQLLVDEAVREGDSVLDAGGGTGSTALLAAARVGRSGKVTVLDASEGMLEVGRARAEAAGLASRMEFHTGDLLHLPFGDGAFDVVLSTYSLCPVYDPAAGILELYRVVHGGGRLGAAHSTWPQNRLVRRAADAVESVVWHFPALSMGCRPVETLSALRQAGARVLCERRYGVPLWPFLAYVVDKPA